MFPDESDKNDVSMGGKVCGAKLWGKNKTKQNINGFLKLRFPQLLQKSNVCAGYHWAHFRIASVGHVEAGEIQYKYRIMLYTVSE